MGERSGEVEALAETEPELEADADAVELIVGLIVERAEFVSVPLAVPDDKEETEGAPDKDTLEVAVGVAMEEAERDPVALAVSVGALDAVARPVKEPEPVPVLAPDGVEKADGEPEKDALEVSVGDAEAEAV